MTAIRLALLGDPVAHSRSPAIHDAAMGQLGIDGSYEARKADRRGLRDAIEELRRGDLTGINITMPLKQAAAESADTLSRYAAGSGSVNSMRHREGSIEGETTDASAMRLILDRPEFLTEAPILVMGTGGAAAAVLQVMATREVHLAARTESRAQELVDRMGGISVRSIVLFGVAVPGAIVVNATPLGMRGEALPGTLIQDAAGLVDLAYGPRVTPATALARESGLPVVDGLEFLTLQAAESFTWWTGVEAPYPAMLAAARNG